MLHSSTHKKYKIIYFLHNTISKQPLLYLQQLDKFYGGSSILCCNSNCYCVNISCAVVVQTCVVVAAVVM